MDNNHQLATQSIDLLAPTDRFASSSRLYGRLHRYQLLLRKSWWVIGLILLFVLAPVYQFTAELPAAYTSKARLWLTGQINIREGRLYTEELIDYLSTQAELLHSSTIQKRALNRLRSDFPADFRAATAPGRLPAFRPIHKATAFLASLVSRGSSRSAAGELVSPFKLKVTEASKSSTLELQATGPDPTATRAFLSCVIDEYFAFKKETRERASDQALASVNGDVKQLSDELKAQQAKLHDFQSSNNVVFLQEQGSSAASYLAKLNRQLSTLRTQLQLLQRLDPDQWIDVESRRADGDSEEPADPSAKEALASMVGPQGDLFRARQQMQLLKVKRDELSRFLRPQHPKIIKLNEDIATQETLVQVSRQEALRQLSTRRQALELQIQNLDSAFHEWDPKAIASSRKIADFDSMRLDLQRLQSAYDHVFGVLQTVDLGKTMDQENVGVLEAASAPRPFPRMLINMAIAGFAALVLAFSCLYCVGLFDDRFASSVELALCLSEEVLGQIPSVSLRHPKRELGPHFLQRQRFEFLESFRNLRSSLLYMGNGHARPKTILITSSVPREGKSTVALYLAATMALGNARVLLIDADMRQSSLHKFFPVRPRPGLAEVLSGETSAAQAIVPSPMDNLSLLPAGRAHRNPGELVLSPEWSRCLAQFRPQFDFIVIDSPPVLATDDAASLAPQVDGVLMIVRGSFTSARMARRGLGLLRQRHAHVLGLVLNRALSSGCEYQYYRQYRHAYQWQPAPRNQALTSVVSSAPHEDETRAA